MKGTWLALFILVVAFGASCQQEETETPTATVVPTIAAPPLDAEVVSPVRLVRNPRLFEDDYLLLSGRYRAVPPVVCRGTTYESPVTWILVAGQAEINAAGSDDALRRLAGTERELEVAGRWQRWRGKVGCGLNSPNREVWYLEVNKILSPNPLLAFARDVEATDMPIETITPTAGPQLAPSPTSIQVVTPVGTEPSIILTEPPDGTASSLTTTPGATSTFTPEAGGNGQTPVASVTGTVIISPTPLETPAPTAEIATSTPETTPTPEGSDTLIGSISYDDIAKRFLEANEVHRWEFPGDIGDVVMINASGTPNLDISLEMIGPDGVQMGFSNAGLQGETEFIQEVDLDLSGAHELVVRSLSGTSGDYALILQTIDSLPIVNLHSNIIYGGGGSATLPEDTDHFWNFVGEAGDVITVNASVFGNEDLVLYLNGPNGLELIFVDDTAGGMEEEILNFPLPSDGYYSIGVGEVQFREANYILTLELGP